MDELGQFLKSQITIPDDDLGVILSNFQERIVLKGRHILMKGQVATVYYFIKSGGLRIYFNKGNKEITGWLAFENEFFTELSSLKSGKPTQFNIHAIETTSLLTTHKDKMDQLYQQFPEWQRFGRLIWETAFLKVINGIISYQTMTAEERYLMVMEQSDLLKRVPLKELSSYLGITQTSLSRLRKNIK